MHGGTVAADNRRDRRGAVVTISLPRQAATESPTPASDLAGADDDWLTAAASVRGARVLVVDDEADGREAVATVLARCGVETLIAAVRALYSRPREATAGSAAACATPAAPPAAESTPGALAPDARP